MTDFSTWETNEHARYTARQMRDCEETFQGREVQRRNRDIGARELAARTVLRPLPPLADQLPPAVQKAISGANPDDLRELLRTIHATHERLVGSTGHVASATLAGDEALIDVCSRLRLWAARYALHRLEKSNPRDRNAITKFLRLQRELTPTLEGFINDSPVYRLFLEDLPGCLSWLFFQRTWRPYVLMRDRAGLAHGVGLALVDLVEPDRRDWAKTQLDDYGFPYAGDLRRVLREVGRAAGPPKNLQLDVKQELKSLACDIRWMRALLLRGFKAGSVAVRMSDDLWLSWDWLCGEFLGEVAVFSSERLLLESHRTRRASAALRIGYDGVAVSDAAPWIRTEVVASQVDHAFFQNLRLLEALHACMYLAYEQVNRPALLRVLREEVEAGDAGETPSEEDVVLVLDQMANAASIAAEEAEDVAVDDAAEPRDKHGRLRSIRLPQMTAALERLDCEVRRRGGDLILFRHGGLHRRLGAHTRWREVPVNLLREVLRDLRISRRDWLRIVDG